MDIIQNGVEQGYISLNNDCSRITYEFLEGKTLPGIAILATK